jgi:dipeptidyl aminopeptidase/acylaminoacyl peptidase
MPSRQPSYANEFEVKWRPDGKKITFLSARTGEVQLYEMNPDGSEAIQVTSVEGGISGYKYAPNLKGLLFTLPVKLDSTVQDLYPDLPKANARIENDLMYRHWDQWHDYTYNHIFVAPFSEGKKITAGTDLLEGERFDSPLKPFGGMEQIAWTPDGEKIAYTCKKLTGKAYAVSTNSDIYLYDLKTKRTINLTEGMPGYDQNPVFSPDGLRLAWESMARDGYEADKNRLMIKDLDSGNAIDYSAHLDQNVHNLAWNSMGDALFFTSNHHATNDIYRINLPGGDIHKITEGQHDYTSIHPAGGKLIATRMSMSMPTEVFAVNPVDGTAVNISNINAPLLSKLTMGHVEKRWIKTTDQKEMLTWVIYPPHFDPAKKYPTLLYCQGGPQSGVSQFWSFRWNFQMMAANNYIIVAPNRRGLPGFGQEWNEQISGDYGGQNMKDYLSAIDALAKEPYVDESKLGAVGASYGGYSVYWLAGNHNKRFKAFIAHAGVFNQDMMYTTTEEMFFVNWDLSGPYWDLPQKGYNFSPHRFVGNWDTPLMVIHGAKDFRIPFTQGMGAFNTAVMKNIPARFLFFPEENHWILKPQNGILWQREFFRWLDTYLKP